MLIIRKISVGLLLLSGLASVAALATDQPAAKRPLQPQDFARLHDVHGPQFSPDGDWIAYAVGSVNLDRNEENSDIWMVSWDGSKHLQLTFSSESESAPRWSPDGRWLAFLSSRRAGDSRKKDSDEGAQLWLLDRRGGEAQQVTQVEGGISDYAWSPDSTRLVFVIHDPEAGSTTAVEGKPDDGPNDRPQRSSPPADDAEDADLKPIVIDRYSFKSDESGYLDHRRDHLYVFELATRKIDQLTRGDFDDVNPAWSPDGRQIAFTSKRAGADPDRSNNTDIYIVAAEPGAQPRQLTTWEGPDDGPLAWSPDGRWIAYLQGREPRFFAYDQPVIALVPATGGEPRTLAKALDRDVSEIRFSPDGRSLYFLVADDRMSYAARVPVAGGEVEKLAPAERVLLSLAMSARGRIAAAVTMPQQPAEIYAFEKGNFRQLSHHNDAFLAEVELGRVRGVAYKTKDGNEVHGILTEPVGYQAGRRYPTLLRIHGGPNGQDGYEFDFERQLFASAGYAVLAPNYRGGGGNGRAWKDAIFADWGHHEVTDLLAGADYMVEAGIADPERLGVGGWSYGGILTNYIIASDSRFKAATSGAGSANMLGIYGIDQYIMQYDLELGLPWRNLEPWLKVSYPFLHADRIKTPTLYLGGEQDFNVPIAGGEQMYQALRTLNVPTQLVIYPGEHHGIRRPSFVLDIYQRYLGWYAKYLGGKR